MRSDGAYVFCVWLNAATCHFSAFFDPSLRGQSANRWRCGAGAQLTPRAPEIEAQSLGEPVLPAFDDQVDDGLDVLAVQLLVVGQRRRDPAARLFEGSGVLLCRLRHLMVACAWERWDGRHHADARLSRE